MFLQRFCLLLLLMALYAGFDYWRHRQAATRWKEYLFILSCGCIAGIVGALNDTLTVQMSPAYFVYGKGLKAGEGLYFAAQCLGAQAGMVAGLIIGGVLLLATGIVAPFKQAYMWVMGLCLAAIVTAGIGAVVVPLWMRESTMLDVIELSELEKDGFYQVWGIHLGFYAGALIALVVAVVCLRRKLRTAVAEG